MSVTRNAVRNVDSEPSRQPREIGTERGESLNTAAPRLLRDAVGPDTRREHLRRYVGWTSGELDQFNAALRAQRAVDQQYWR